MKKVLEIAAGAAKKAAGTALALVGKGFSLCPVRCTARGCGGETSHRQGDGQGGALRGR